MRKPVFGLFVLLMLCVPLAFAGLSEKDKADGVRKTSGDDLYRPFLINNVFNYYSNNGDGAYNKYSASNEGFEFFKGSGKTCIFEEGVVWVASTYNRGSYDSRYMGPISISQIRARLRPLWLL